MPQALPVEACDRGVLLFRYLLVSAWDNVPVDETSRGNIACRVLWAAMCGVRLEIHPFRATSSAAGFQRYPYKGVLYSCKMSKMSLLQSRQPEQFHQWTLSLAQMR